MALVKIVVCGDVMGNFRAVFSKVKDLNNKKGPFESLCCVGNFFGSNTEEYEELKSGKIEVPILTYIINGNQLLFKDLYEPLAKAVPNIVYLGKMGCITCATGLKIAYLSGVELPEKHFHDKSKAADTVSEYNIYISRQLVNSLIDIVGSGVDILLTSQWPKGVIKYAVPVDQDSESKINDASSCSISYLAKCIKPRYHFSGLSGLFYERLPYRNHAVLLEKPLNPTRFIGLAPVNEGKIDKEKKWLYAFSMIPQCSMQLQKITETHVATVCPYDDQIEGYDVDTNFFFDASVNQSPSTSKKRSLEEKFENQQKKPTLNPTECWFCMTNPNVGKEYMISIGNHSYITVAKGVLVPEHVFIVPIDHVASSVELSDAAYEEIDKFKVALTNYFHDKDKDVIFFERNYCSPHMLIQVVPIPKEMEFEIERQVIVQTLKYGVKSLPTSANIKEECSKEVPIKSKNYFYLEHVADRNPVKKFVVFNLAARTDFPLQIGRYILADVLNLRKRKKWQKCCDTLGEQKMAEEMRTSFKTYDFTRE